jgi:LemA protein
VGGGATALAWTLAALAAGVAAAFVVGSFNAIVRARNQLRKAWSNIDVLLRQRHDEIPALAELVRAAAARERETLETITRLRARYDGAGGIDVLTGVENELLPALLGLLRRAEAYPDLKANAAFLALQARLTDLETRIAERRTYFNDCVAIFNTKIQRLPERLCAAALGCRPHPFLDGVRP